MSESFVSRRRYFGPAARGSAAAFCALAVAFLMMIVCLAGSAAAQTKAPSPATIPKSLTVKQVDQLLARMTDAQARKLLSDFLMARARQDQQPETLAALQKAKQSLAEIRRRLPLMISEMPELWRRLGDVPERLSQGPAGIGFGAWLLWLGVALVFGVLVAWLIPHARRLIVERLRGIIGVKHGNWAAYGGDLIGWLLFAAGSSATIEIVAEQNAFALALYRHIVAGILAIALAFIFSRHFVDAVSSGDGGDPLTRQVRKKFAIAWLLIGLGFMLTGVFRDIAAPQPPAALIVLFLGWTAAPFLISAIWQSRKLGSDPAAARLRVLSRSTWVAAIIGYVVLVLLIWAFLTAAGSNLVFGAALMSFLLLGLGLSLDWGARRLILGRQSGEESAARPSMTAAEVIVLGIRYAIVVVGVILFFRIWGVDIMSDVEGALGPSLTRATVDIALIVFVAIILLRAVRELIDRKLQEEGEVIAAVEQAPMPTGIGQQGKSRLATLLPLARAVVTATVVVIAALTILTRLGVAVGPILAGAGVVGVAIGFGSQTLVRDIVSGAFFLIDDAFRIGEYIESGNLRGTVERIGVRSLRVRHHRGAVHTIPYGELKSVTNYSRDWAVMKLEFRLPFGTDIERVRKLIKKAGEAMAELPEFKDKILEPLKSQGVVRTEGAGLVFSAKFTTKPGEQFVIRREAFSRIQEALQADGIELAPDSVAVRVVGGKDAAGAVPEGTIEGAAAAAAGRTSKKAQTGGDDR